MIKHKIIITLLFIVEILIVLSIVKVTKADMNYFYINMQLDNKALRDTIYNYCVKKSTPCIFSTPTIEKRDYVASGTTSAHYDLIAEDMRFNLTENFYNDLLSATTVSIVINNSHILNGVIKIHRCYNDTNKQPCTNQILWQK